MKNRINFLLLIVILFSCNKNDSHSSHDENKLSAHNSTFETKEIYKLINDSLNVYSENRLTSFMSIHTFPYLVDSVICLNEEKNKLIGAILIQCNKPECKQDDIEYLYGAKIKEKWYFFTGPTLVIFRKKQNTPNTFEELSNLAYKNIFRHYLKRKENGELEINEKFFDSMENKNNPVVSTGYGPCYECKTFEEYVMYLVQKNWSRRDTTDYATQ
ncbi:hypothetical protein [uncultured Arcticibacterium sp.]|uniref:hypothetical protein n=1 Tax=uncultured Arcticibacterium sp. TaxID=2173042 RepID=UPI0030F6B1B9